VAAPLADPERTPLGAGPEPLEGRAFVDVGLGDDQVVRVQPLVADVGEVLGIGDRRGEHLADRLTGGVGVEFHDRDSIGRGHPAHQVDDPAGLHRGHPDVARGRAADDDVVLERAVSHSCLTGLSHVVPSAHP
jgi:hypothetical protein